MKIGDLVYGPFDFRKVVGVVTDIRTTASGITGKLQAYCHVLWGDGEHDWEPLETIEVVRL